MLLGSILGVQGLIATDKVRWGKPENFLPWAIKKSARIGEWETAWQLKRIAREGPIISLTAEQSEHPDTSTS